MTRHSVAFTILALTGLVLTLPDPSFARPSFRPAFTGGSFRLVLPAPRGHFGHRITTPRAAFTVRPVRPAFTVPVTPIARSVALGPKPFRMHRRGLHGLPYPVTYGGDVPYFGTPYDPSDIPVYGPADDAAAPVSEAPRLRAATPDRGCRAEQVTVPKANAAGDSIITIVRC